MKSTLIIVADNSRARVFTADTPHSPIHERATFIHPEGRMHEQKMVSDLPGKIKAGGEGHAYQDKVNPKQQEAIDFAKEVAEYLDNARKADKISQLLLVAAPKFLGELRKELPEQTKALVVLEVAKDLTQLSAEEIRAHLPEFLPHTL